MEDFSVGFHIRHFHLRKKLQDREKSEDATYPKRGKVGERFGLWLSRRHAGGSRVIRGRRNKGPDLRSAAAAAPPGGGEHPSAGRQLILNVDPDGLPFLIKGVKEMAVGFHISNYLSTPRLHNDQNAL